MPLKNVPRVLSPELLSVLASMGHGDELLIADANFPSSAQGAKYVIHCEGSTATDILEAVLELLPLDSFIPNQAAVMKRVDSEEDAPIIAEFSKLLNAAYKKDGSVDPVSVERVERFAFYDRAKKVFAICVTGESRLYGNIIVTKGVIGEDGHTVLPSAAATATSGKASSKRVKTLEYTNLLKSLNRIGKTSAPRRPNSKAHPVDVNQSVEPAITESPGIVNETPESAIDVRVTTAPTRAPSTRNSKRQQEQRAPAQQSKQGKVQAKASKQSGKKKSSGKREVKKDDGGDEPPNSSDDNDEDDESDDDPDDDDDDEDSSGKGGSDSNEDNTVTLFSARGFQHQTLKTRRAQEEVKTKRSRRSLNSLSSHQQMELALERSMTESTKE